MIDIENYDFEKQEYKNQIGKYALKVVFIAVNGFILLGCIYVLIFILIPIIKFRIFQCSKKRESKYSEINERLGSISLLKERETSQTLL